MRPEDFYDNVVATLKGEVEAFRAANMPTGEYINWDAHAQITELPQNDVIGLAGVGMAEDEPNRYDIVCGISISTWEDPDLSLLTKLISKLRAKFLAGTRFSVFDHETAAEASWMVAALPLGVMPVGKAETRSVQSIEVHLLLDPGAASSLR